LIDNDEKSELVEHLKKYNYIPEKIATTIFNDIFLDTKSTKTLASKIYEEGAEGVEAYILKKHMYGGIVERPWFKRPDVNFEAIKVDVYQTSLFTEDRSLLEYMILTGRHLPKYLIADMSVRDLLKYIKLSSEKINEPFNTDPSYLPRKVRSRLDMKIFSSDEWQFYVVDMRVVAKLMGKGTYNAKTRERLVAQLNNLSSAEIRYQPIGGDNHFIDEDTFKFVDHLYLPIINTEDSGFIKNKNRITPEFFTHQIIGVSRFYVKSLAKNSAITREKFSHFAQIPIKQNVDDFVKSLATHTTQYLCKHDLYFWLMDYYNNKSLKGGTYITTKVLRTLRTLTDRNVIHHVEKILNVTFEVQYDSKSLACNAIIRPNSKN
ncbi:hypothetical protein, partial [Vibrio sp. 10N.222.49.A4]